MGFEESKLYVQERKESKKYQKINIIKNRIARNCSRLNEYKVIKRILVRQKKVERNYRISH